MDTHPFDPATYRNAMALYAGHVQIVTTAAGPLRRGVTITAACSVSDQPPMVLACLNNTNANNAVFFESGVFALNTLGARHRALADAFSGRTGLASAERFALGDWMTLASGAPVLADALASFDCRILEMKAMATHTILIGAVEAVHFGPPDAALLYHERQYRTV